MSIQSEIERIRGNVAGAYAAIEEKGGALPEEQTSENLAAAVRGIPSRGASGGTHPDPVEVYRATRPADWLPMPEPADNEIYLLLQIPDGASSLLAFTATCLRGPFSVELGTVKDGGFVSYSLVSIESGGIYEGELFADDFGDLTSSGMKQAMVKVSGSNIRTWSPAGHSKKTDTPDFTAWNIVEIACRLPRCSEFRCGSFSRDEVLYALKYFSWYGKNLVVSMSFMFYGCHSLIAVLAMSTANVINMNHTFCDCWALTAIPEFETENVQTMSDTFHNCRALTAIPDLNTSNVTDMTSLFRDCHSLNVFPKLDTSNVTSMGGMCSTCYSLPAVQALNTQKVTSMGAIFDLCYSLTKITFDPTVTGWAGYMVSLIDCALGHQALVDLFNSLPVVSSPRNLTLTRNPGVAELTDAEKAIATEKNWTLVL